MNLVLIYLNDHNLILMNLFLFLKIKKMLHKIPYKAPISAALIKKPTRKNCKTAEKDCTIDKSMKPLEKISMPNNAPNPISILLSPPPHWPK